MSRKPYSGRVRIRSCGLVLRGEEILLVRMQAPTRPHPIWMPPGGEVRMGESLEEAAKREVFEETGLEVEPGRLSLVHQFVEPPWHALEFYFICHFPGGKPGLGHDPERGEEGQILLEVAWFDRKELHRLEIHPPALSGGLPGLFAEEGAALHLKSVSTKR